MTTAIPAPRSDESDRIRADIEQTLTLLEELRAWKTDIAAMRRDGHHTAAALTRDDILCRVERWLDPDGMERRAKMQKEQGKQAAGSARMIDTRCGF